MQVIFQYKNNISESKSLVIGSMRKRKKTLGNLTLDNNGLIKVNDHFHFQTSLENVLAGGDIINGGTTAVQAVAEGMKAAVEMDKRLCNNIPSIVLEF